MSCWKALALVLALAFVALLALSGVWSSAGAQEPAKRAQRSEPREQDLARLSVEVGSPRFSRLLEQATLQNVVLKSGMSWSFGGRAQRGWSLYLPLISSVIGAEDDPANPRFALKLSRWQAANKLQPSGILDDKTWSQMIAVMQSTRIQDRNPPDPTEMVVAPVSDFYDPERPVELRKVERRTYNAYRRMVREAESDPSLRLDAKGSRKAEGAESYFKIISAYRSPEYQDQLRKRSQAGRASLALNSAHSTGRALDIYVGGDPVSTKDENRAIQIETPAYRWLVKNAARFGFRPYFYEPWHWEHVSN